MVDTLFEMPCLRCGRILDVETDAGIICSCGAIFRPDDIETYSRPGFYREWIAALACACGRVDHYDEDGVTISPHRCASGGVMWMKN